MTSCTEWLDQYFSTNDVVGWVDPGIVNFLRLISEKTQGMRGGAFEVGVHHGKFFIAINGIVNGSATSIAMDLYEEGQRFNIDGSGNGSLQHFKSNLSKYDRHQGHNVLIECMDSTVAHPKEILMAAGRQFSIVSIDGGHTAEHTISDLRLAEQIVDPNGFVFVDDVLNSHWLGVIDGVTQYLRTRPILWPIAYGFNKLLMCRMSAQPSYRTYFESNFKFHKTTALCGYEFLVP